MNSGIGVNRLASVLDVDLARDHVQNVNVNRYGAAPMCRGQLGAGKEFQHA